jgi:hypothetical protein
MSTIGLREHLCLDERILAKGAGTYYDLNPGGVGNSAFREEALKLGPMARFTQLWFGPGAEESLRVGDPSTRESALITAHLARMPAAALVHMLEVPLGSLGHDLSAEQAAARADLLRIGVLMKNLDLAAVNPLYNWLVDENGRLTTRENAKFVKINPAEHLAQDPYQGVSRQIAEIVISQPYPPGSATFSAHGIRPGLADGLIQALFGEALRANLGALPAEADPRSVRAMHEFDSHSELMRFMEDRAGRNIRGVVERAGTTPLRFVAKSFREDGRSGPADYVVFVDEATGHGTEFPLDLSSVRVAELTDDALAELLPDPTGSRGGPPVPADPGTEALEDMLRPEARGVALVKQLGETPAKLMGLMKDLQSTADLPVLGFFTKQNRGTPLLAALQEFNRQLIGYLEAGRPPVVITNSKVDPLLLGMLQDVGASLLSEEPMGMGTPWVIRRADGTTSTRDKPLNRAFVEEAVPPKNDTPMDGRIFDAMREGPANLRSTITADPGAVEPMHAQVKALNDKMLNRWLPVLAGQDHLQPQDDLGASLGSLLVVEGMLDLQLMGQAKFSDTYFAENSPETRAELLLAKLQSNDNIPVDVLTKLAAGDNNASAARAILWGLDHVLRAGPGQLDAALEQAKADITVRRAALQGAEKRLWTSKLVDLMKHQNMTGKPELQAAVQQIIQAVIDC